MCVAPLIASMAASSPGFAAATVLQGVGGMMRQSAMARSEEIAAEQAEQQAQETRVAGRYRYDRAVDAAQKVGGQQRAAFAESGIDPTVGSAAEVMADTAAEAQLDLDAIMMNTDIQATALEKSADAGRKRASTRRAFAPLQFLSPVLRNAETLNTAWGA